MKYLWLILAITSVAVGAPFDDFVEVAKTRHGEPGEKAARFLVEHMSPRDQSSLQAEFLIENLDLAFKARAEFPWAGQVPDAIFMNDVLPYAVFDEPRDPWRADLYEKARKIVKNLKTGTEAAQALNRHLFKLINVHYNTGRKRANQSPKESMQSGMCTCTGLAIILVDACRAVGVPARAVGTTMWANERGNHTWVEIWDRDWHFTGADEYDKAGLDRGWFVGDAAQAKADVPRYAIYATSWKREGVVFPMPWARRSMEVAAVNVTSRYVKAKPEAEAPETTLARLGVRLFQRKGGKRMVAKVSVFDKNGQTLGEAETKAGKSDLNDLPRFHLKPGLEGRLRFTVGRRTREMAFGPLEKGDPTVDAVWSQLPPVRRER